MSAANYTKSLIKEKENNYVRKEYYHSSGNKRRLQSRRKPDPRVILECLSALLHCYRDDPAFVPDLDFVMELGGEMIGQIIYVRSEIDCDDGRKVPIMTFGPIGVAPAYKRQGYGKQLLDYSMEKAKEMGAGALAITGNIDFYGKSGFVPAKTKGVRYADDPDADYFLIRELNPGFLDGVSGTYKDPEGYFVCEKDPDGFERFEATFPVKEKQKLPGQLF